ncbi:hypothetical protein C2E23DRAFT_820064 [Lenzites betulinus]|nr:hypothetical protein C2E23DRAFT_820064 [Lenzites betulinus]
MPLKHRGYGAYISCDGRELEQLRVKVEDKTVSCYVPVDTGTEYKVHWVDSKPPSHISVEVRTDGRRIGVVSHVKGASKPTGLKVPLDATSDFLHVRAADDDVLPAAYSEELGVVEIRLRRVRHFITVPLPSKTAAGTGPRRLGGSSSGPSVSSKGASVKSASIVGMKENRRNATVMRPILIDDKPYVVFRFLYRPTEVLEGNDIKPPAQPASASTSASKKHKRVRGNVATSSVADDTSASDRRPSKRRRRISEGSEPAPETVNSKNRGIDDEIPFIDGHTFNDPSTAELSMDIEPTVHDDGPEFLDPPSLAPTTLDIDMDSELEEEKIVEVHLSSRGYHAPPSTSRLSPSRLKVEPEAFSVKREPSPEAVGHPVSWAAVPSESEDDVKPKAEVEIEDNIEDPVLEVHLTSRNQHTIFGTSRRDRNDHAAPVKKEESPERTFMPNTDMKYEDEETILEVHISSRDLRPSGLTGADHGNTIKAEPTT